ncbi:hypothetical protein Rvan_0779 [Rhodomicrobium vannielii ATCC 17100]|uniref:Lipoprotein n=1 Tax=Rhodomicrobium vannielii (strain ATCC 17100 / DSM 162 / LMG 4299 / NCIMB 10020 / ATH 3.1.1) TaxID=648757 RepID=E3I142_RHOVT|nr:hypothetical protein [Rhodomicrobium vannielii]ADP70055.1 hypothetical protein Rvan_0779 [Rhodomicrobium vannielii ATCC 17100]
MRTLAMFLCIAGLCGCAGNTITQQGSSFNSSETAALVPFSVELVGVPCKNIVVDFAVKTSTGYRFVRNAGVKLWLTGVDEDSPRVYNFEPGEYYIAAVSCNWDNKKVDLFPKNGIWDAEYRYSYAYFLVPPTNMVNIGKLRISIGFDNTIKSIDVVDLSPAMHTALKQQHPNKYAKMETHFMAPTVEAIGTEVKATETVLYYRGQRLN